MEREIVMMCGCLIFGMYFCVLMAIFADLISGIRKAQQRGEARRSKALRRTIDKVCKYYNALFAMSVIDCIQMGSSWYYDSYWSGSVPLFPLFTLIGSVFVCAIEIKSIYEKADEKDRADVKDVAEALTKLIKDKNVNELMDFIETKQREVRNGGE